MVFGLNLPNLVNESRCWARPTPQPMKIKPRKDLGRLPAIVYCSWLTCPHPDPALRKTPGCVLFSACLAWLTSTHASIHPLPLRCPGVCWCLSVTSSLSCSSFGARWRFTRAPQKKDEGEEEGSGYKSGLQGEPCGLRVFTDLFYI